MRRKECWNYLQCFTLVLVMIHIFRGHNQPSHYVNTAKDREFVQPITPWVPMEIPRGEAIALPSIRIMENETTLDRKFYGGKGDKPHLGGFTEFDSFGVSPRVWKFMVEYLGVKTLLDVGCGRGISTAWFVTHGVDARCVEGSHDAVERSMVPEREKRVTEHDFARGPWWPPSTVDAIWCVEFLEHVGRQFHHNYLPAFRKAAIIFVTHSEWGGWHHVEVHSREWWIQKFELYGFQYSEFLTNKTRSLVAIPALPEKDVTGKQYRAAHIGMHLKVFINPAVASLPQHVHLMAEHGCYDGRDDETKVIKHKICGTQDKPNAETKLPESFHALKLTPEMDDVWNDLLKKNVDFGK